MKKIVPIAIVSLLMGSASYAAPFMAIGDGAELFVTGSVGIRADDNIFLTAKETDDVIFDITPGFDLTFGKDAQVKGALTAGVAFTNYSDNDRLNTELLNTSFRSRFDDGKVKLNFDLSFTELNQNTPDVVGLTRRDVFSVGGNGEVEVSQLTSLAAGVSFSRENYKKAGYTDSESLNIPLDFYYKVSPKVDVSAGYRYREYYVDLGQDSSDNYFMLGGRGEFSPKLVGKFAVGYGKREFNRGGDDDLIAVDGSFSYEVSPKTSLQFGASHDFGTSPQGVQQKNLTVNGAVTTKLTEDWSVNGGLSYRRIDYGTRTDDYIEGNLGAAYIVNAYLRLQGAYVHREYKTVTAGGDFSNNVFSIAANLRY